MPVHEFELARVGCDFIKAHLASDHLGCKLDYS